MHILLNVKNSGSWFNKFILKQCTWKSKAGRIKPVMLSSNFLSRWKCCEDTISVILCCCSVTQLCPTLHNPMDCSTPGFPVLHHLLELCSNSCPLPVMPSNHLCRPFLLLPSIFPSIRVFSKESALYIRWPEYWSFSLGVRPCDMVTCQAVSCLASQFL